MIDSSSGRTKPSRTVPEIIFVLIAAFSIRVVVRMAFGGSHFWTNSYSGYYDLARNVIAGKGLCFETTCAWWPPVYPLFLALTSLVGRHYLFIVVPQAIMGTGTVLLVFLIGQEMFGTRVGFIACVINALYPYYVVHDTALQE